LRWVDALHKSWQVLAQFSQAALNGVGVAHTAGSENLALATTLKVIHAMGWLPLAVGCHGGDFRPQDAPGDRRLQRGAPDPGEPVEEAAAGGDSQIAANEG
jgi:hypothetical protein